MANELNEEAYKKLKRIVDNIIMLNTQKKDIQLQSNDLLREAGICGFNKKVIRKIVAYLSAPDVVAIKEEEELVKIYKEALGIKD
jgi:uncharacterized protein (UPF0335 family)